MKRVAVMVATCAAVFPATAGAVRAHRAGAQAALITHRHPIRVQQRAAAAADVTHTISSTVGTQTIRYYSGRTTISGTTNVKRATTLSWLFQNAATAGPAVQCVPGDTSSSPPDPSLPCPPRLHGEAQPTLTTAIQEFRVVSLRVQPGRRSFQVQARMPSVGAVMVYSSTFPTPTYTGTNLSVVDQPVDTGILFIAGVNPGGAQSNGQLPAMPLPLP